MLRPAPFTQNGRVRISESTALDTSALTEPYDADLARAYAKRLRREGRWPRYRAQSLRGAVVTSIILILLIGGPTVSILAIALSPASDDPVYPRTLLVALLVVVYLVVMTQALSMNPDSFSARFSYRIDHFARANGFSALAEMRDPERPGVLFGAGGERRATDVVTVEGDRPVEYANYIYTTGRRFSRVYRWGYVGIRLHTTLPHIMLDARGNDSLLRSNLPTRIDRRQRLRLEGDFDRFFTLYCPRGYERDALYLFTPDIMTRFIDRAAAFDIEIVDDWLFLYSRRPLSTLDPETWEWLFSVTATLDVKLAQWERWRDTRAASDGIATPAPIDPATITPPPRAVELPGRRLRLRFVRTVSLAAVVIVAGLYGVLYLSATLF